MRAHLDLCAEELVARGWPAEDARRDTRLKFGNPRVKLEEVDALNQITLVETLARDLRAALLVFDRPDMRVFPVPEFLL
jgi:hypothetical protein